MYRSPCRRARWTRSAVFYSSEPTPELPTSTETQRNSPVSSTEPVEGECDVNGCDGAQRKHVLPAGCARRSNGSAGSVHRRRRRDECQQRRRHGTASGSQERTCRRRQTAAAEVPTGRTKQVYNAPAALPLASSLLLVHFAIFLMQFYFVVFDYWMGGVTMTNFALRETPSFSCSSITQ